MLEVMVCSLGSREWSILLQLSNCKAQSGPKEASQTFVQLTCFSDVCTVGAFFIPVHKPYVESCRTAARSGDRLDARGRGALLTLNHRELITEMIRVIEAYDDDARAALSVELRVWDHEAAATFEQPNRRRVIGADDRWGVEVLLYVEAEAHPVDPPSDDDLMTLPPRHIAQAKAGAPARPPATTATASSARVLAVEAEVRVITSGGGTHRIDDDGEGEMTESSSEDSASEAESVAEPAGAPPDAPCVDADSDDDVLTKALEGPCPFAALQREHGIHEEDGVLYKGDVQLGSIQFIHGHTQSTKAICCCHEDHCLDDGAQASSSTAPPKRQRKRECYCLLHTTKYGLAKYALLLKWLLQGPSTDKHAHSKRHYIFCPDPPSPPPAHPTDT